MRIRSVTLSLMAVVITTATLQAQTPEPSEAARKAMERELIQMVVTYWTPKLNDYRRFIDRSLSASDLTQLNNLRLRFEFVLEQERQRSAELREQREARMRESEERAKEMAPALDEGGDAAISEEGSESDMIGIGIPEPAVAVAESESDDVPHGVTSEVMENEFVVDTAVSVPEAGDGSGFAPSAEEEVAPPMVDDDVVVNNEPRYDRSEQEPERLLMETTSLGARYGTMSDLLRKKATEDFSDFLLMVADLYEKLMAQYPGMRSSSDERELSAMRDQTQRREVAGKIIGEGWSDIRPFVMLYNGQGLVSLFHGLGLRQVEGVDLSTASIDGADLVVGHSGVMQNSPNPASTSTLIAFRLAESSSTTSLKIYAASGQAMADIDLGSLPSGEHEVTIDVSVYPPGTYVYHLAARSTVGEEVFSKMMQVVR